jgi:hypothetical protein
LRKKKNFQKFSFFNEKRLFEKNTLSAPYFRGQKNLHFLTKKATFCTKNAIRLKISNLRRDSFFTILAASRGQIHGGARLTNEFGCFVDENSLQRNINRNR